MIRVWGCVLVVSCLVVVLAGCPRPDPRGGGPSPATPRAPSPHPPGIPDDEFGLEHPPHGPMSGHRGVLIRSGDDQLVVEVAQNPGDEHVTVWILDEQAQRTRAANVDQVIIRRPLDQQEFQLEPVERTAEGLAHTFKSDDLELAVTVVLGAELEVQIDGQTHVLQIPRHNPH